MLTPLVSALLELCENPQAVTHLLRWSGDRDASAPQLLLHIWRREEETTGVSRDPHGLITGAHASLSIHRALKLNTVSLHGM